MLYRQAYILMKKYENGISIKSFNGLQFATFNHGNASVEKMDVSFNGVQFIRKRVCAPWKDERGWWHTPGIFIDWPKSQRFPSLKGLKMRILLSTKPAVGGYVATFHPIEGDRRVTPLFLVDGKLFYDESLLFDKSSEIPSNLSNLLWKIPVLYGDNPLATSKEDASQFVWYEDWLSSINAGDTFVQL